MGGVPGLSQSSDQSLSATWMLQTKELHLDSLPASACPTAVPVPSHQWQMECRGRDQEQAQMKMEDPVPCPLVQVISGSPWHTVF